jgi:hypothetical protein
LFDIKPGHDCRLQVAEAVGSELHVLIVQAAK